MFPARHLAASLLTAGAFFVFVSSPADAQAGRVTGNCEDAAEVAVLPSPLAPWKGAPLRILVAEEKPLEGELSLIAPDGSVAVASHERHGGPPYFWFAEVAAPAAGTWHMTLVRDGAPVGCGTITREIAVAAKKPAGQHAAEGSVWQVRASWSRATEDLYSAWITKLFDAPLDTEPSWKAWHEVLRDRSRNFLFNYLGLGEDNVAMSLRPDCADFVYFLRAYFAFKMGLPFGYSNCSRGTAGKPPKCYQWFNILHPESTRPPPPPERETAAEPSPPAAAAPAPPTAKPKAKLNCGTYLRDVGDVVQTGAVRVAANDDNTDFYMIPLTQDSLRPGIVYADPYGHVLTLVKRLPEANGGPGIFLAVDAEPDGSITRKKFWR